MHEGGKAELANAIRAYATSGQRRRRDELARDIELVLRNLADEGAVDLGPDECLVGESLEIRVRQLFISMGLNATHGRAGLEDLTIPSPIEARTTRPFVVEIKSDRKPFVQRDQLRQLDDWVFDLSQEDVARRHGLGGGIDPVAIALLGMAPRPRLNHPTPHKGMLVFNGPIRVPFADRVSTLVPDERDFAMKRGFCVVPFGVLIELASLVRGGSKNLIDAWELLQVCEGEFTL